MSLTVPTIAEFEQATATILACGGEVRVRWDAVIHLYKEGSRFTAGVEHNGWSLRNVSVHGTPHFAVLGPREGEQ
jgi:hypothetical protein